MTTPTRNIGCIGSRFDGKYHLRCDIRSYTFTAPRQPKSCPNEYGDSFTMAAAGAARWTCHGGTALPPSNGRGFTTMRYGRGWAWGSIHLPGAPERRDMSQSVWAGLLHLEAGRAPNLTPHSRGCAPSPANGFPASRRTSYTCRPRRCPAGCRYARRAQRSRRPSGASRHPPTLASTALRPAAARPRASSSALRCRARRRSSAGRALHS